MKKRLILCLVLVIALMTGAMIPASAELDANTSSCISLQAQRPLGGSAKILDTAKAVILYELNSKTMVYHYNPDTRIDPSGMNKIMTALLALEMEDPERVLTVTRKALDSVPVGSVSANLKRDEQMTLHDLLYCMMVGSANDAAAVIAEQVGGTQDIFVELMNQRAIALGCRNTNFVNPTGISAKNQYSTARDLAVITEKALENELFKEMFCADSYTVPETNKSSQRKLHTTNYLMSTENVKDQFDSRVTGGKTGAVSTTDRSLICTAQQNGSLFLSVVMQASGTVTDDGMAAVTFGSFEETRNLLDFGFERYSVFSLLRADQVVEQFHVEGCENLVSASPANTLRIALPQEVTLSQLRYESSLISGLSAPVKAGQKVGTVHVWYDGICVGQSDLVAMHDVLVEGEDISFLQPTAKEKLEHSWTSVLLITGAVVMFLAAAGGTVLVVLRIRSGHKRRITLRRRQKQRSV